MGTHRLPRRPSPATTRTLFAMTAAALLLGGAATLRGQGEPPPDFGTLAQNPPKIKRLHLQRLREPVGNATSRLLARFQPDPRFGDGSVIPLPFEGDRELAFHDDGREGDDRRGDGLFTALVPVSELQLQALNRTIAENIQKEPTVPSFDGRVLTGRRKVQFFDIARFREFQPIAVLPLGFFTFISQSKSLMITHTGVVEDPTRTFNPCTSVGTPLGKWTFGHLMREMCNQPFSGVDPRLFTRRWLEKWRVNQFVNGDAAPARLAINAVISQWEIKSGVPAGGPLNLALAPFKLLAIVNRVDLRENAVYGGGNAGEARFVFCLMNQQTCQPLPFLVIFEYGVPISGCENVRNWGQEWVDLNNHPIGSAAYNAALEDITDQFSLRNLAPAKPNRSALNQLRTNENRLNPVWELREFVIDGPTHLLRQDTTKQSPRDNLNNTIALGNHMNTGVLTVPPAFLGAKNRYFASTFLNAPNVILNANRHRVSFNSCDGCHAREAQNLPTTFNFTQINSSFTHVKPAPWGSAANLSPFLTGVNIVDPANGVTVRHFDDLQRRAQDLSNLVNSLCAPTFPPFEFPILELFFEPVFEVH